MATIPVVTIFGDATNTYPELFDTGRPGNHVRSYVAGVFDADIDLGDALPSQCRVGVIYHGTDSAGTIQICLNGLVIHEEVTAGCKAMAFLWETALDGDPTPFANAGFLDFFEVDWTLMSGATDFFFINTDFISVYLSFNSADCKQGWYIDQATGLGDGVLDTANPIYCNPMMMYTAPHPQPVFALTDVLELIPDVGFPDRLLFDTVADITMNVNLGGYTDSWEYTGSVPAFQGVYYLLGNPTADTAGDPMYVDGGTINSAGNVDTWSQTNSMNVSGDKRLAYIIPEQYVDTPVPVAGLRTYPAVNATYGGGFSGFIEALNFSQPVLFEQWFTTDLQGVNPSFWTQRVRAVETP